VAAVTGGGLPWTSLTGIPSAFEPLAHSHGPADVTGFDAQATTAALASGYFAAAGHSHPIAGSAATGFLSSSDWMLFDGKLSAENDPKVGTLTPGKWCTSDGTTVRCTSADPTPPNGGQPNAGTASPVACSGTTAGYLWYDAATNALKVCNGTTYVTVSVAPPTEPTITSITPAIGSISIAFSPPANSGGLPLQNYEYSTNGGVFFTARSPASVASPLVVSGLATGTYAVKLRAVSGAGPGTASASQSVSVFGNYQVFSYSGSVQTVSLPAGATTVKATVWGAAGGGFSTTQQSASTGGAGGYAAGTVDVSGISTLAVVVGRGGSAGGSTNAFGGGGGVGSANAGDQPGAGGGLSGVFRDSYALANALVVAGGGGGGSGYGQGGNGGGSTGNTGAGGASFTGGVGGSQSGGGAHGSGSYTNSGYATDGSALQGGTMLAPNYCGAGGGGGYYGGGSGTANNWSGSSGGGGSGYVHATLVSSGTNSGSAQSTALPPQTGSADYATGVGAGVSAGKGGDGRVVLVY